MDILPQLLVNALISGSIYALAAAGLAISYGLLRILNFAHGHTMMAGAYSFFLFHVELGWGILPTALASIACMAILGIIALKAFIFPFLRYSPMLPFVTTLALSTILESSVAMTFGVNVKPLSSGLIETYEIGSVYITPLQIFIIASALVILGVLAFVVHGTSVGRKMRSLAQFEAGAESLGISARGIQTGLFIVSALLACYAGVLIGFETNLQPTMGNVYTIKTFAAMTLGGLGNLWGTVVGSYLLGLVENLALGLDFGGFSIPAGYKDAFAFMVILLVLLFRPQGLFVKAGRKA